MCPRLLARRESSPFELSHFWPVGSVHKGEDSSLYIFMTLTLLEFESVAVRNDDQGRVLPTKEHAPVLSRMMQGALHKVGWTSYCGMAGPDKVHMS